LKPRNREKRWKMEVIDRKYMKRALALARRGVGKTAPNPAVGCVIVKDGIIVGEGWHKKAGEPHAEAEALVMAGEMARGADAYVTLEPCCHTGRTPPCSKALAEAGVKRVIAGMSDPNPMVNGNGVKYLESKGIMVYLGMMEEECRNINRGFIKQMTKGVPYITYKCAMTLDGRIATYSGDSRWISSAESRKRGHRLRALSDAVMVGVDTVISDDPLLTVRDVKGRNPVRIILDSRLRTAENSAIIESTRLGEAGTIIATISTDEALTRRYLDKGVSILHCAELDGRVDPVDMLERLGERGINSILLEGGGKVAGELLKLGLIDECLFFYAPLAAGGDGYPAFAINGISEIASAYRFRISQISKSGCDIMVRAFPEKLCSQD